MEFKEYLIEEGVAPQVAANVATAWHQAYGSEDPKDHFKEMLGQINEDEQAIDVFSRYAEKQQSIKNNC